MDPITLLATDPLVLRLPPPTLFGLTCPKEILVNFRLPLIALALLPAAMAARCESLPIDPGHTAVILTWTHRGLSHPVGRMEKVVGTLSLDTADLSKSSVSVTLPLEGLRTGSDALDKRLKGPEFFDAAQYPQITFTSTRVEPVNANALRITGDLSVHGVTRPVVLDARINKISKVPPRSAEAGFDADVQLLRSDFGVGKFVPLVSDQIAVHITLEAYGE
jgi:polyisoprenoid-binding protein YceI